MIIWIVICIFVSVSSLAFVRIFYPIPIEYDRMLNSFIGGEPDDNYTIAFEKAQKISNIDQDYGEFLKTVLVVFKERALRNKSKSTKNAIFPKVYIRTLNYSISERFMSHPLRFYALAECYSMLSEVVRHSSSLEVSDLDNTLSNESKKKALRNYRKVYLSPSVLVSNGLKYSTLNNIGNIYYYSNQLDSAIYYYEKCNLLNRNLSTSGNLIAMYTMTGESQKAIDLFNSTEKWAVQNNKALNETSGFTSLYLNVGFAYLIKQDYENAIRVFRQAHSLSKEDMDVKLNLAMSLILAGKNEKVEIILSECGLPEIKLSNQFHIVAQNVKDINKCAKLLYAFSISDFRIKSAYYYTFLGIPKLESELQNITLNEFKMLKKRVHETLTSNNSNCSSYLIIPEFEQLFF